MQLTVNEYKELESYKLLVNKFGDKHYLETIICNYKEMLNTKDVITVTYLHDYSHGKTLHTITLSESLYNTELYIKTKLETSLEVGSLKEQLKNEKEELAHYVASFLVFKNNWFNRLLFLFNKDYTWK